MMWRRCGEDVAQQLERVTSELGNRVHFLAGALNIIVILGKSPYFPVPNKKINVSACNATGAHGKHSDTFGSSSRYIKLKKIYIFFTASCMHFCISSVIFYLIGFFLFFQYFLLQVHFWDFDPCRGHPKTNDHTEL